MDLYSFYTRIYGYTRNYRRVPIGLLTPIRRLIRNSAKKQLPKYFLKHPADINKPKREDVVISLTSFPARIDYVYMTIESLLRQTSLPGKVILWLSKEQFPTEDTVPERLKKLQNQVFAIRYVDGDIRSHKKYYYSFQEFPEKTIITVDDDIIYPPHLVEQLLATSDSFPNCIVANIARKLSYTDKELDSYAKWPQSIPYDTENNVQIGAGGVLYPSNCLYEDCLKIELSQKLASLADDLWLNTMARLKGTPVVKTSYNRAFLPIVIKNDQTLSSVNNGLRRNDEQLNQIRAYYASTSLGDPYQYNL